MEPVELAEFDWLWLGDCDADWLAVTDSVRGCVPDDAWVSEGEALCERVEVREPTCDPVLEADWVSVLDAV